MSLFAEDDESLDRFCGEDEFILQHRKSMPAKQTKKKVKKYIVKKRLTVK